MKVLINIKNDLIISNAVQYFCNCACFGEQLVRK